MDTRKPSTMMSGGRDLGLLVVGICFLVLVVVAVVFGGGVLVLLVLGDQVVHVALGLRELHLVHALAGVPVEEGLAAEHGGELLADPVEHLLDGGSTTVSETLGDGKTEKVSIIRSGYSSLIFEMSSVPMPEPVPPPREWHTWKPELREAIAVFCFLSDNIKNRVNEFCTLSVMPLCPVVSSTRLPKYKVIRTEYLPIWTSADAVHGTRLQIHENSPRNKSTTRCLVVVDINTFELHAGFSSVSPSGVDTMLITYYFPELGSNLITTLTTLDVEDFPHLNLITEIGRRA
ncbi:unnamed protein product [Spirodela intermedia]|uniref:Uncharacterized protein n=1 Tax=Spirodela intermedia TaxID=51605 RepID=A0A7I8JGA0_SPIIN|nr:unnamed protein product [Spirodela intermedia]CAA6669174.1 unnamed protein product [Spirodela intermedia]